MSRSRCPVCWHEVDVPNLVPKAFLRLVRHKLANKIEEAIAETLAELQAAGPVPPAVPWMARRMRHDIRKAMLGAIRKELERVRTGDLGGPGE